MSGANWLYQTPSGQILTSEGTQLLQSSKPYVKVLTPTAGSGPFAASNAPFITVGVTGLTTAAGAASSAILVNTSAVSASSRIKPQIINYAGTWVTNGIPHVALGPIVAGTSFSFQIINIGASALAGQITIAFTVEN